MLEQIDQVRRSIAETFSQPVILREAKDLALSICELREPRFQARLKTVVP
jgi:hypothetical protein